MDLLAHLVVGVWLYTKYKQMIVIPLAMIFDVDHLLGYVYDKRKNVRKLPKVIHLAYRPRSWFHSLTGMFLVALPLLPFFQWQVVITPLASHLFLDMLDKSGLFIFPPLTWKKIRGALPVGYLPEDPMYMKKHKRSHIPSIIVIIAVAILGMLKMI